MEEHLYVVTVIDRRKLVFYLTATSEQEALDQAETIEPDEDEGLGWEAVNCYLGE